MTRDYAFAFLTPAEAVFLDAAMARLIPADALGPGALQADVTRFIDLQLASPWGAHARNYRMGPWRSGTPQQGYQLPLSPQQLYREALREIDARCVAHHGRPFCQLDALRQDEVLHDLEHDRIALDCAPARTFFALLWQNTQEGFFADPVHGGNKDKIGWRLIGFPGVAAADYAQQMTRFNIAYRVEPVSILDIAGGRARVDAQGYPEHVPLSATPPA